MSSKKLSGQPEGESSSMTIILPSRRIETSPQGSSSSLGSRTAKEFPDLKTLVFMWEVYTSCDDAQSSIVPQALSAAGRKERDAPFTVWSRDAPATVSLRLACLRGLLGG